jgi:hypothetical protein
MVAARIRRSTRMQHETARQCDEPTKAEREPGGSPHIGIMKPLVFSNSALGISRSMIKDRLALGVRALRGESSEADDPLDDWLGDEAELDWFPEATVTSEHRAAAEDGYRVPLSDPDRTIRRRRAVALAAILIVGVVAVVVAIVAFGGSGGSGTADTAPITATTPATPPATTPASTTPPPAVQTPASLAVVLPDAGTLRTGDDGSAVKKLQRALTALGFAPGKADGLFGPLTKQAVVAFQQANGLAPDGIVGAKTAGKINSGLARQKAG